MDYAFDRLSEVQKRNINKQAFYLAYNIVIRSKGDRYYLMQIIEEERAGTPAADLLRYCRLVESVI